MTGSRRQSLANAIDKLKHELKDNPTTCWDLLQNGKVC
jgi:hypothetical protein